MNDSTATTNFYSSLTTDLVQRSSRAVVSYLSPLSPGLRLFLRQHLDKPPGQEGSFLADPVFEATFGWKEHAENMGELAGRLLDPALVDSMDAATKDRFERRFHPYTHQVAAWKTLQRNPPQSVVVSSGTGSGKTECFLVPILDSLARQRVQGQPLVGVQALFLYPLNALINSQRDRLRAWTAGFQGDIKFCLYNGQTPQQDPPVTETRKYPQEVMGRPSLRKAPPPILITNATMLEYMLVRQDDAPIIEHSKGRLRWIVLDEAHTYVGSQAAEISLLLRRVLHAFDVEPEQVRFIATSATIGKKGDPDALTQLQRYLANVAGLPTDRVHVIEGTREVPQLPQALERESRPLPDLDQLAASPPKRRYSTLAAVDVARKLRNTLAENPAPVGDLATKVFGCAEPADVARTLRLLDIARTAKDGDTPFLPLRAHLFQRTQPGLWACVNPNCTERQPELKEGWPFGHVFLEHREKCKCDSLVFELVMCRRCGVEYLGCESGEGDTADGRARLSVVGLHDGDAEDDDGDEDDAENTDELDFATNSSPNNDRQLIRWVATPTAEPEGGLPVEIDVQTGVWSERSDPKVAGFFMSQWLPNGSRCPRCGEHEYSRGDMLRTMNLGAPFLLGVSIPTLLEHVPPKESALTRPFDGRRIITFSDSRQGTARFALKSQIEAERNFVRSYLYHSVQSRIKPAYSESDVSELNAKEQVLAMPGLSEQALDIIKTEVEELRRKIAAPAIGVLSWREAIEGLAQSNALNYWILPAWKIAGRNFSAQGLAEFLILREVARRPMRQNSVETLGLVRVAYPEFNDVEAHGLPSAVSREGLTVEDWSSLLKLLLDLVIRSNTAIVIDQDWKRWMGTRIVPKFILGPHAEEAQRNKQMLWPYIRRGSVRSRFVNLLGRALDLDLSLAEDHARINDLLLAAWDRALRVLQRSNDGHRLSFSKSVMLTSIQNAWFCPVTRRVLDTTFRGYTPYIPREVTGSLVCEEVAMPPLKYPFPEGGDSTGRAVSAQTLKTWLESDPQIKTCRERGIWTDFSDRIATSARYYRVEEHSAQQSGHRLEKIEKEFKEGAVNVLSCSTTMEMGVDIGGLSAVAMNNAPPGPSNFLQRAGRAGRRGETAAVSLTMCRATPHGEAIFANPQWPFVTPIHVPRVSLDSDRIVQRHINALCLTHFLAEAGSEALKLRAGWFVERPGKGGRSASDLFLEWLGDDSRKTDSRLQKGVADHLVRDSKLQGQSLDYLLGQCVERLEAVVSPWRGEFERLVSDLEEVGGPPKKGETANPAQLGISRRLRRLRHEYLLGELATRGFLPGYGFPTGVVPFINSTIEDLRAEEERRKRRREGAVDDGEREDGPSRGRSWATRELPKAIREYAPGARVVLDGKVFTSDGVTLNWQTPPGDQPFREIQALRSAWRCHECGNSSTSPHDVSTCEGCGGTSLYQLPYLQPPGFATNIFSVADNDLSNMPFTPVEAPWISVGPEPWVPLPRPEVGRMRASADGSIFHHSAGSARHGYAICLVCGRAQAEVEPPAPKTPPLPRAMQDHYRLRGGKERDNAGHCPGNQRHHAIKRHYRLGVETRTDVFELQLTEVPSGHIATSRKALSSVAVALRRAAAEHIGVEDREIGWAVIPARAISGGLGKSIVLYDTAAGGAGFVASIPAKLLDLLRRARELLKCPVRQCDKACHGCLLSYDTQHEIKNLDRRVGADLLSTALLDALQLPQEHLVFGDDTKSEYQPLEVAVSRELRNAHAQEIRVYLAGDPESWDLAGWSLRSALLRWAAANIVINLCIPAGIVDQLDVSNRSVLAVLIKGLGLEVHEYQQILPTHLTVEIGGSERVRWSTLNQDSMVPGPAWANVDVCVYKRDQDPLVPLASKPLSAEDIRPPAPQNDTGGDYHCVEVLGQFRGPLSNFGRNFWNVVFSRVPALRQRLESGVELSSLEYTDRYLRSPLMLRALLETLKQLQEQFPPVLTTATPISIRTTPMPPQQGRSSSFEDNWPNGSDRRDVAKTAAAQLDLAIQFTELDKKHLAHYRGFNLSWSTGETWHMRLDEGFGFLGVTGSSSRVRSRSSRGRSWHRAFPFNSPIQTQTQRLLGDEPHVDRRVALPSYLYVEHIPD
ncbi:DEAD/DEAH box helicase [Pseudenhygromyxa sp. WMMC2535]|uniref:DEAD/DEAH box helicase n=1 Tax=Pseudenhygromyxa sp. WMMC2535 TaxID=2712867 RepID=UPI0015532518|nr:DEAD/DEAH box helicase [Pseudenhygromyxa sp. WMMC2535]NVB37502.1 DEAD/DEAH box helicase [Pseudenhygromyxa sp. WMMC2535]